MRTWCGKAAPASWNTNNSRAISKPKLRDRRSFRQAAETRFASSFRIDPGRTPQGAFDSLSRETPFSPTSSCSNASKCEPPGFRNFLTHGLLSDQLVEADDSTIQNMYRRLGYEAAFVEPRRSDSPNHEIDLVFEITENQRYPVESVTLSGNRELPESELRAVLKIKEGDFYSPAETDDARTRLMAHYYEQGFPDAAIEATADPNPETRGRQL